MNLSPVTIPRSPKRSPSPDWILGFDGWHDKLCIGNCGCNTKNICWICGEVVHNCTEKNVVNKPIGRLYKMEIIYHKHCYDELPE